jgi:hypothetical protein
MVQINLQFGEVTMNHFLPVPVIAALFVLSGCAQYEYDLIAPAELSRHIGPKDDQIVRRDPLEYRLRAVEDRLVMSIFNSTDDPITLLGDHSYVVAPSGQSHPLRSQTIAPHTFIKLILPPMRPFYQESGPTFGIGIGLSSGYGYRGLRNYDPFDNDFYDYASPRYFSYYDPGDVSYWNWEGESDARMHFVFERDKETFSQEFTFHRKKM